MQIKKLAEQLGALLQAKQQKIVTIESCTGGGLAFWITDTPGSSAWFERGFVTYCNQAKHELANVPLATLERFGAVSQETVEAMAEGGLINSHSDVSIAITGIAGPTGGTAEKPIGTVWTAFASHHFSTQSFCNCFKGDRQAVREQTISFALEKLADILRKKR